MRKFIILACCIGLVVTELNVPEALKRETNSGRAGVKARLSPRGINFIANFLTNALITELVTVSVTSAPQKVSTGAGEVTVNEMTLTINHAPGAIDTRPRAPASVLLQVNQLNIAANLKLGGAVAGNARITTSNAQANLEIAIVRNFNGAPNLRIASCKIVHKAPINLEMASGPAKDALNKEVAELLQSLLCSRAEFITEERINERFSLLSPKMPLANINDETIVKDLIASMRLIRRQRDLFRAERRPRESLITGFNVTRAESLFLDYTILNEVKVNDMGVEIETSGEVSLRGRGGTPFGAVPFSLPPASNADSMLQMVVSDFVPNSLMYHGHTIGLFNTHIDPSTPHFGPIMKTTCSLSSGSLFCLGDLFPTLRRMHPNQQLSMSFSTVQAPVIQFKPTSEGGISFSLLGKIVINIVNPAFNTEEKVAEMGINVDAKMKIRLSSSVVRPKISLNSIILTTLSPGILLQKELDDSVLLAREVLQRMVNDVLREGIPIPVHPLFQLNKPKVKVLNRALLLQTNFDLNERLLRQLTAADLRKRVIRV
uniref:BPI2 domain-containing protein n=1 Tax=Panagrellus redivivus TaxID=6233 RepID=A0A7E4UYR1_PANRE